MRIIICDKDESKAAYYKECITGHTEKKGRVCDVQSFTSGEKLLFEISDEPNDVDIIYTDIDFGDKTNGIDTMRRLREIGYEGIIIFMTTDASKVFESFDVHPFQFLIKEDTTLERFGDVLEEAIKYAEKHNKEMITFACAGEIKNIAIDDILFFEVSQGIIEVHYGEEVFEFYSTLDKLENQLQGRDFVRVHKNYLVNMDHVERKKDRELIMDGGEIIPVGKTMPKDLA